MNGSGKLIVFEGGEGCGKTAQILRVQEWLHQSGTLQKLNSIGILDSHVTREPGGTPLCSEIRQLLLRPTEKETLDPRTELLLYAADRAQHVEQWLRPLLAQNTLVLCDRYTDSTVAYQGYGRGLDIELIYQLNQIATQGLEPDLTLWLDVDVEVGLARAHSRGQVDRIEQADIRFHEEVRRGFESLAQKYPHRIKRIDASGDLDTVFQSIKDALEMRFEQWRNSA